MPERFDAVVLGAGPAGASAALSLAWSGKKTLLIEKQTLPREKVCGGFIGPENKPLLELYGVWDRLLEKYSANLIERARLTAGNHHVCEIPLTAGGRKVTGLGILRRDFDYALVERARECGVEIAEAASAEIVRTGKIYDAAVRCGETLREVTADFVINARGSSAAKSASAGFGVAAPFENVREMDRLVVLHFARHAHVGINQAGPGLFNICYVADDKLFKEAGGDLEKLFQSFCAQNGFLRFQIRDAKRIGAWKGIPVGRPLPGANTPQEMLNAGDTRAIVNPVIGGGNTLALWGGWFVGRACAQASSFEEAAEIYRASWQREFSKKARISHWWGKLSHSPFWSQRILHFMNLVPALPKIFFETHHTIKSGLPEKKLTEKEVCV